MPSATSRFGIDHGVTALLGPNGAGKSTLFRMLCGLTPPSRGTVDVLGANPRTDRDVRGRVSLVPQQDALFDHLSASEFLEFAARTHAVVDPDGAARRALELVDLTEVGTKPVGQFSKGMRQRVKVAAALVNDPEVLILDEPLTGLDPVQRRHMIALFHRLGDEGRCVLVSSHVLDEVAKHRIASAGDRAGSVGRERRLPRPARVDGRPRAPHPARYLRPTASWRPHWSNAGSSVGSRSTIAT